MTPAFASLLIAAPRDAVRQPATGDPIVVLMVVDGLRPDAITPEVMPNLDRLRREGVEYVSSHSMIPTVTRVNGSVLATSRWPRATGIVSNAPFIASFDSLHTVNTASAVRLRALAAASGGRLLAPTTLAERMAAAGKRLVSVNAGSGGNGLLSNPEAARGHGILINANLGEGGTLRFAYPDSVARAVVARAGPPPADSSGRTLNALQSWADRIVREYVLGDLRPDVVTTWTTEPDESQHRYGVGSPEAIDALRHLDADIGLLIRALDSLGVRDRANVIVTSDHGFARHDVSIDIVDSLIAAGLKRDRESTDLVVTGDAQSVQLHVARHDSATVRRVVEWLQRRSWVDVVFTSGGTGGTFALSDIHLDAPGRAPDVMFTFPWSDAPNQFGAPGAQTIAGRGRAGPLAGAASGHGGLSPWAVHNTLILWGAAFKTRTRVTVPAGTVDIVPTILEVMGLRGATDLDGRPLREAMHGGPAPASIRTRTRVLAARAPGYEARLQISEIMGGARYVDKAWRVR